MNLSPSHRSFVALCLLGATAMACSKAPPTPEKETVSPPSAAPLSSAEIAFSNSRVAGMVPVEPAAIMGPAGGFAASLLASR